MRDPETGNSRQLLLSSTGRQMSVIQFSEPGEICGHGRITSNRCVTQKNALRSRRRGMDSPTAPLDCSCVLPCQWRTVQTRLSHGKGPSVLQSMQVSLPGYRSRGAKTPIERQVEANIEHFRGVFRFSCYYLHSYLFSYEMSSNLSSVSFLI